MNNSFRSLLAATSRLAMGVLQPQPTFGPVAPARGKKPGASGRHLIRREVDGPFFRQVGLKHLFDPEGKPLGSAIVTERYLVERVVHATKGWRRRNRAIDRQLYPISE